MNPDIQKILDKYHRGWGILIIILLVVSILLAGGGVWILEYSEPVDTIETDTERINVQGHTSSVAAQSTDVYNTGDTIERSPIQRISTFPELQINHNIDTERETEVDRTTRVRIIGTQNDNIFWDSSYVSDTSSFTVDENHQEQSTIDIIEIRNRAMDIRDEFDGQGNIEILIITDYDYENEAYSGESQVSTTLTFRNQVYMISEPEFGASNPHDVSYRVQKTNSLYMDLFYGSGIALGLALIAGLLRFKSSTNRPMYKYQEMRYNDWISRGETFNIINYDKEMRPSKLKDLVDIAIDTDNRVVFCENSGRYIVTHNDILYEYNLDINDIKTIHGDIPDEFENTWAIEIPKDEDDEDGDDEE